MEASRFFFPNMVKRFHGIYYLRVNVGIRVHVNSLFLENVVREN